MSRPPSDQVTAYHDAVAWATYWSQRWFLDRTGRDRFQLGDIAAGWSTHVEAFLILRELALAQLGMGRGTSISATAWLKQRGYDRAMRSARLRLMPNRPVQPSSIASVVGIPTPSMTEPAAIVVSAAEGEGTIAIADHRAARFLRERRLAAHPLVLPWRQERALVAAARATLQREWAEVAANPPAMPFKERDLGGAAVRALRPLILRSMPFLAPEAASIERYLTAACPSGVALASDQHRIERLAVAVSRRLGIRSVVLQHGLPQDRIGYLPVIADAVATWSQASRHWFIRGGTPDASLVVTGNPRLDAFVGRPAIRSAGSTPVILLALSPTARPTNQALVSDVVASLEFVPNARLIVKLHPGASDWGFVRSIVRGAGAANRVDLRRHEPLHPLLTSATAVVVHRSSVAVEALAAGRPVIVHRAGSERTTADLELADLKLRTTENPRAIAESVMEFHDEKMADRYLADRAGALAAIAGPLDGRSAQRILELLRAA